MAERTRSCGEIIKLVSEELSSKLGFNLIMKKEQYLAVESLLDGLDVLGVLPTGYGKSLIYQVFVLARKMKSSGEHTSALVVSPLNSLIEDQITEANSLGISAASLNSITEEELKSAKFQLLFASAESVLENKFLSAMKNSSSQLHRSLCAVIVDECHVVEMWTGKRYSICFNKFVKRFD